MTSPAGNKRVVQHDGFSLVELLVVVAIMGVLAGAAAVSLRGLRSPALKSAAGEIASAMKMTRQMAITSGRRMYLIMPLTRSALSTNLFRSYAIFEEVRPQEEVSTSSGTYTNTGNDSLFLARTDWRVLPDGAVINNFASIGYASMVGDPFIGVRLGIPEARMRGRALNSSPPNGEEWRYFLSVSNFTIRNPTNPVQSIGNLNEAAYLGFRPDGRAFYFGSSGNLYRTAALRLAQGFVQDDLIALTDTNNYFYVETDPVVGRIRVRARESYRHP